MEEVEKPTPRPDEVLIKVYAATVNRTDCGFRSAEYFVSRFFSGLFKPKYRILGNEFAGIIEAIGKDVKLLNAGDKVFGYNDTKFGAHAEYLTIAETDAITTIPDGVTFEQADRNLILLLILSERVLSGSVNHFSEIKVSIFQQSSVKTPEIYF